MSLPIVATVPTPTEGHLPNHSEPPQPNATTITDLCAEFQRLRDQVQSQATELVELRQALAAEDHLTNDLGGGLPFAAPTPLANGRASRRGLLGRVAATLAVAGVTAIANASTAHAEPLPPKTPPPAPPAPQPAEPKTSTRASGNPLLIGVVSNFPTLNSEITGVRNAGTDPNTLLFLSSQDTSLINSTNLINTVAPANARVALAGISSLPANTAGNAGPQVGAVGIASDGVGVAAGGLFPLRLGIANPDPQNRTDAAGTKPGAGTMYYQFGNPYDYLWFKYTGNGDSYIWRRLASQGQVGVLHGITPVRVLDTRPTGGGAVTTGFDGASNIAINAGPFPAANTLRTYRVGGHFGIPTDIRGLVGNVTLVQSGFSGGYVTILPGDYTAPIPPTTATINPAAAITGNSFFVATHSDFTIGINFNIAVFSTGAPRDVIIDVTGYYI